MNRLLLGLHTSCCDAGVHGTLLEMGAQGIPHRARFVLGMFQPFSLELQAWMLRAGSKSPAETRFFPAACAILEEDFSKAALATIREGKLGSAGAASCDEYLGGGDQSARLQAFQNWGPGFALVQKTGLTVVALRASKPQGKSPWFAFRDFLAYRALALPESPVVIINMGGSICLTGWSPGGETVAVADGPCGSFLELFSNVGGNAFPGVDALSKKAVQGKCREDLLTRWRHLAQSRVQFPERNLSEYLSSLMNAIPSGVDPADLLCTAHYFVVDSLLAMVGKLPRACLEGRWILTGSQARNGLFRQLLATVFGPRNLELSDTIGIPAPSWDSYSRGVLGGLALKALAPCPGNYLPGHSPAAAYYPGQPASWASCLGWMNQGLTGAA